MIRFHKRRGMLCAFLLAALLAAGGCNRTQPKLAPAGPPVVEFVHPTVESVNEFEEFTGRTEAIAAVEIRARVSGYLQKVEFKDGAEVEKDQMLFQIDDSIYKATLEREDANVKQAKARLDRATADFKRMDATAPGSLTPQERDLAVANKAEAEAAYASAVATHRLAAINDKYTRILAPISGRISRRLVDPGNLVKADETALTMIVTLDPIYAYFDVDERTMLRFRRLMEAGKVQSSRTVEITVEVGLADEEGFPDNPKRTGVINFVDNHLDPGTGTLRVRARVPNPRLTRGEGQHFLSPGMFVRIRLPIGKEHPATLIPEEALATDQGQKVIYVINEKDEVQQLRIGKLGALNKGKRVIESVRFTDDREASLQPTDRVIVSGQQRVRHGTKVQPKEATKKAAPKTPPPAAPTEKIDAPKTETGGL